jgi:hypothetical protein
LHGNETNHFYTEYGEEQYDFGFKVEHNDASQVAPAEPEAFDFFTSLIDGVLLHLGFDIGPFETNEKMTVAHWRGQAIGRHVDQGTRPPIATMTLGGPEIFGRYP